MFASIQNFLDPIWHQITVFFLAMVPVIELRGAIPLGAYYDLPIWLTFVLAVIGNIVPVPFILLFVTRVFAWLKKYDRPRKIVEKFENRIVKKSQEMKTVTFVGLMLFVAIPLPGTGAWTGAGVAALLEMRFRDAMLAVILGVLMAGVIVTAIAYGFLGFLRFLL